MRNKSKSVCIYCGAHEGHSDEIIKQSRILAEDLARMGFDLVYGGGKDGLMRLAADTFLRHGRNVVGIRPEKLVQDEELHEGITSIEIVPDMYVRKARMIELADILIALPGGIGTMDEVMDAFAEIKLGFVNKPLIMLNTEDYYSGLKIQIQTMVKLGFLREKDAQLLRIIDSPIGVLREIEKSLELSNEIDKLAYIAINNQKILTTLSKGRSAYYIPGGKRDNGESDEEALIREVKEELTVDIHPSTIKYLGTYKAQADGKPEGVYVKMTCYSADYHGTMKADNEIGELKWMSYSDRDKVSHVDKLIFDDFKEKGLIR